MNEQKRCWAEISPANILHNYRALRAAIPEGCRFLGVVKADAYGHGALETAQLLEDAGADYLAVACLDEALELRRGGITMPILILGHTPGEYTKALTEHNITQAVTGMKEAEAFSAEALRLGTTLRVHMAVDTGMSRIGFLCTGRDFEQGTAELISACRLPGLEVEGVFTLPVLYALEEDTPVGEELRGLLTGPLTSDAAVDRALELLHASTGRQQALEAVQGYLDEVEHELDSLPQNSATAALRRLAENR